MLNLNFQSLAIPYRRFAALSDVDLADALGLVGLLGTPRCPRNGALHLSLGLAAAGIPITGPIRIDAGPHAGRRIDYAANRLGGWLASRHGEPEVVSLEAGMQRAAASLAGRRGIAVFVQPVGPTGGTAVLLDGCNAAAECVRAMRHHVSEIHFWPLS